MIQTKIKFPEETSLTLALPTIKEVEIIYKKSIMKFPIVIKSSHDTHRILMSAYDMRKLDYKEFFYVVLVNRANYCIGVANISIGSTFSTIVNEREIFQLALKSNATGIILSHNHPSGRKSPSDADINVTKKVKDGCKLLDIALLDHIIVTREDYYSFADEGML